MGSRTLFLLCLCSAAAVVIHGEEYIMEGYFVLDQEAFVNYEREEPGMAVQDAMDDLFLYLTSVNRRLASLSQYGIDISLKILDTEISNDILQTDGDEKQDVGAAVKSFQSWLKTTQAKQRIGYDFAVYFTGRELSRSIGKDAGTICEEDVAIVAPFDGSAFMVNALAKNLGYILGANEDGSGSGSIMRTHNSAANDAENFVFSECTAFDIKEFFAARDLKCLLETSTTSFYPNSPLESYMGRAMDPDLLCTRAEHGDSYACRYRKLYGDVDVAGDALCRILYCSTTTHRVCSSNWPIDGMACNKNSWCMNGKCVPDTTLRTEDVLDGCPLGDSPVLYKNDGTTCASVLEVQGSPMCYKYAELCCATCAKYRTTIPKCEWGNQPLFINKVRTTCEAYLQSRGMSRCESIPAVAEICCKSCANWLAQKPGKRSDDFAPASIQHTLDLPNLNDRVEEDFYTSGADPGDLDPRLTAVDENGNEISTQKVHLPLAAVRADPEDVSPDENP